MSRLPRILSLCLVLAGTLTTASAREVVEFRTGLYLEIRSHEILEDTARLYFSKSSYLAIPLEKLDRIEREGREVFRADAAKAPADEAPAESVNKPTRAAFNGVGTAAVVAAARDPKPSE